MQITKAGRPEAEQRAVIEAAGVTDFGVDGPVYIDRAPKRRPKEGEAAQPALDDLVHALRPGDVVLLAGLDVLASTRDAIIRRLGQIGAAGAAVRLLDAGETLDCNPVAVAHAAAVERAVEVLHRQRAAAARAAKAGRPSAKGGRKPKITKVLLERARSDYFNLDLTNGEVEERTGVSYRSLHRHLGARGSPPIHQRRRPKT